MKFFIKDFGIVFCALYCYEKINHTNDMRKMFKSVMMAILIAVLMVLLDIKYPFLTMPTSCLLLCLYAQINNKKKDMILIVESLMGFSISYILFGISALISCVVLIPIPMNSRKSIEQIICVFVQILLTRGLLSVKRLRKGIDFLELETEYTPIVCISISIIAISIILNWDYENKLYFALSCILIYSAILIVIYWRTSITRSYLERLGNRNIASLNEELLQKDEYIKKLEADVECLGKIVHRDNKLVPAMEMAVERFIMDESGEMSVGSELLEELRKMSKDRKGLVTASVNAAEPGVNTGVAKVDNLITYMSEKAANGGITLKVTVGIDIKELLDKCIDEESFCTLLADLLDNAIIATKYNNARDVLLDMSMIKKAPAIHIFDSGIPFDKEVLINYGIEQTTTHGDDGGSGIGLMQTYEILAKCRASIFIDEFSSGLYTKKISVVFDRKRQFLLYTPREDSEVSFLKRRADLTVVRK